MSWMYCFAVERPPGSTESAAEAKACLDNYKAAFAVAMKSKVVLFVPAEITSEVAAILARSPLVLPGSTMLIWFEPFMEEDIRRQAQREREHCSCPICTLVPGQRAGKNPFESLLTELLRSDPKKPHDPS